MSYAYLIIIYTTNYLSYITGHASALRFRLWAIKVDFNFTYCHLKWLHCGFWFNMDLLDTTSSVCCHTGLLLLRVFLVPHHSKLTNWIWCALYIPSQDCLQLPDCCTQVCCRDTENDMPLPSNGIPQYFYCPILPNLMELRHPVTISLWILV
jgi:hypothetical protein